MVKDNSRSSLSADKITTDVSNCNSYLLLNIFINILNCYNQEQFIKKEIVMNCLEIDFSMNFLQKQIQKIYCNSTRRCYMKKEAVAQTCSVKRCSQKFRKVHRKTPVPEISKNTFFYRTPLVPTSIKTLLGILSYINSM